MLASAEQRDFAAAAVVLCLAVGFLAWSYTYPSLSGAFPRLVGWTTVALAAFDAVRRLIGLLGAGTSGNEVVADTEPAHTIPASRQFLAIAAVASLVAGMYLLGFLLAIFVFIAVYIRVAGGRSLLQSALIAAGTTGLIYLMFDVILSARLPMGVLLS